MTHKPLIHSIKALGAVLSASGLVMASASASLYATVTGQGTTILEQLPVTDGTLRAAATLYPPQFASVEAGIQLILGMLLLLLGLFIRALARTQDERPVHITIAPPKKKSIWFWMEMRF